MIFHERLRHLRGKLLLKTMAARLGYSISYLSDLERGNRLPSVRFVNEICRYCLASESERKSWHREAAKTHGWDI